MEILEIQAQRLQKTTGEEEVKICPFRKPFGLCWGKRCALWEAKGKGMRLSDHSKGAGG